MFGPGASISGTETDTANYGRLFASGSGTAVAGPGWGSLFFVGNTSDTPIGAVVSYTDILTISGAGPVSIDFTEVFGATLSSPRGPAFASDFLDVHGLDIHNIADWNSELDVSGSAERVITFNPGSQVIINEAIAAGCSTFLVNGSPPDPASASCSFQGSDQLYVHIMTPGGGYSAASGTAYADAPAANGVPEPAAWALMLLGFGGVGAALRMRRKMAAASA